MENSSGKVDPEVTKRNPEGGNPKAIESISEGDKGNPEVVEWNPEGENEHILIHPRQKH